MANGRTIQFSALKQISNNPDPNDKPGTAGSGGVANPAAEPGPEGGAHIGLAVRSAGIIDTLL